MTSEMVDLRERLVKAKERIAELEAAKVNLNTAWDEAIASKVFTQKGAKILQVGRIQEEYY